MTGTSETPVAQRNTMVSKLLHEKPAVEVQQVAPFGAEDTNPTSSLTPLQLLWLRRCLPVFAQPEQDVRNGYGLQAVFVKFVGDECHVSHIYKGEASYDRWFPTCTNPLGTFLYRSFNYWTFRRTADIDDLVFRGVDLNPDSDKPWASIWTLDHAGSQTWSQGRKFNCLCYSFVHHYQEDVPFHSWSTYREPVVCSATPSPVPSDSESHKCYSPTCFSSDIHLSASPVHSLLSPPLDRDTSSSRLHSTRKSCRPLLYLNTMNHLIHPEDGNPSMTKNFWHTYPLFSGGRQEAEAYARAHVPHKWNLFSLRHLFSEPKQEHDSSWVPIDLLSLI